MRPRPPHRPSPRANSLSDTQLLNRVLFEVPDLPVLNHSQTVVDMHFHSVHSDGTNALPAIVRKARELGIGIAITDHNSIAGALEIARYTDILNIPGIEVTSREGAHVLVYFYDTHTLKQFYAKDVRPFLGRGTMSSLALEMKDIIRRARQYEALIIFPHPYCAVYTGICNPVFPEARQQELLEMADGVEVINAGNIKKWNLKCTVLGFNLNKAMTGGSDGHHLYQMGKAVTCAAAPPDRIAFLNAVRRQETRVIGKEVDFVRKMAGNSAKLPVNLKNAPDLVGKQVRYSQAFINKKSRLAKARVQRQLKKRADRYPGKNGLLNLLQKPFREKRN